MRVVVDTNVVVNWYATPRGTAAAILRLWDERRFDVLLSAVILAEFARVLHEPEVRKAHRMSDDEIAGVLADIEELAEFVTPADHLAAVPNDPDDDKIVECAVEGKADYIVTGDKHLLALGSYRGIQIVPPAVFVRLFDAADSEDATVAPDGTNGPEEA